MRIASKNSVHMICHREDCRCVKNIRTKNLVVMDKATAYWMGYGKCKFCDGMDYHYKREKEAIENYTSQYKLDVDMVKHTLYVRTDAGCWRIAYSFTYGQFVLFHKNHVDGHIALSDVEDGGYHKQGDHYYSKTIMGFLRYIKAHDTLKAVQNVDYHKLPQDTRRQKKYYQKAKKQERRNSIQRVNNLFAMLEQEKERKAVYA